MRNYTITSVWGIPIRINVSLLVFLPVLAWLIGSGQQIELYAGLINGLVGASLDPAALRADPAVPWLIGIAAAVGLFASVTVHELGHSWMALRYGLEIESITLWILGGIANLGSIPREWNREFWIAVAGPAASVLVAAACYAVAAVLPASLPGAVFVFGWLAITNLVLTGFNLLPAFPMDGGRVLRALLSRSRPYGVATRIAARVGVVFALLFAVVGVLSFNVILVLLALFVYGAATSESRLVLMDELLENLTVGDIGSRDVPTIDAGTPVADLVDRMMRERRTAYPVVDDGAFVGVITLDGLRNARGDDSGAVRVGEIAGEVPRVDARADAFDTLAVLGQANATHALVEEDGVVTGLLSQEDYSNALTIRRGGEFRAAF